MTTRVYHPSIDAFEDVPEGSVKEWEAAGWKAKKPAHVDDSGALPPGEFYVAVVPVTPEVEVDTAPAPAPAPAPAEDKPKK